MANYHCTISNYVRKGDFGKTNFAKSKLNYDFRLEEYSKLKEDRKGYYTNYPLTIQKYAEQVEKIEKRIDAQFFKTIEFSLPKELTEEENKKIATEIMKTITPQDQIFTWVYHDKGDGNPHIHGTISYRKCNENGELYGNKNRDMNSKEWLNRTRETVEKVINKNLEIHNQKNEDKVEMISCKSYKERGIDKEPTIHYPRKKGDEKQREEIKKLNEEIKKTNELKLVLYLKKVKQKALNVFKKIEVAFTDKRIAEQKKQEDKNKKELIFKELGKSVEKGDSWYFKFISKSKERDKDGDFEYKFQSDVMIDNKTIISVFCKKDYDERYFLKSSRIKGQLKTFKNGDKKYIQAEMIFGIDPITQHKEKYEEKINYISLLDEFYEEDFKNVKNEHRNIEDMKYVKKLILNIFESERFLKNEIQKEKWTEEEKEFIKVVEKNRDYFKDIFREYKQEIQRQEQKERQQLHNEYHLHL